jgi:ABC-2 type transport system permease protein
VTSEWSQRTALVTFTQVPSRLTVVAAKFVAAVVIAVAAVVVGAALAALANLTYGGISGDELNWEFGGARAFAMWGLAQLLTVAAGFAFGLLFLNTPVAIVVYLVYVFILPEILGIGAYFLKWFADLQPWVDFAFAQGPLVGDNALTGEEWAHLGTSGLIWLGLPIAVGVWRVLRSEVK